MPRSPFLPPGSGLGLTRWARQAVTDWRLKPRHPYGLCLTDVGRETWSAYLCHGQGRSPSEGQMDEKGSSRQLVEGDSPELPHQSPHFRKRAWRSFQRLLDPLSPHLTPLLMPLDGRKARAVTGRRGVSAGTSGVSAKRQSLTTLKPGGGSSGCCQLVTWAGMERICSDGLGSGGRGVTASLLPGIQPGRRCPQPGTSERPSMTTRRLPSTCRIVARAT
jgi:hypothetical protein